MNAHSPRRRGRFTGLSLVAMASILALPSLVAAIGDAEIRLRSGVVVAPGDPSGVAGNCLADRGACEAGGPVLLKLMGPADGEFLQAARSAGIRVVAYVGENAFIVYLPEGGHGAAAALPGYGWSARYRPELRLSPSLLDFDSNPSERSSFVVVYLDPEADAEAVGHRARLSGFDILEVARGRPRSAKRAARWGRVVLDVKPRLVDRGA